MELSRVFDDDSKILRLHDSQAMIQIINANTTFCLWQRGGGKTGGGIGPRFLHLSQVMPRSQVLLFSDTYKRLQERIVPNIIGFLESKLGWVEGIDFVKYCKPPEHFTKPIIPIDKYETVISTVTGMALCLVSLHVEGSANAYNAQAAIGDEVKYCDERKINTELLPALRGAEDLFGHLPEYLSVWMFTDKYGPNIRWLLKKKQKMNAKAVDVVYNLQMKCFELLNEIEIAKKNDDTNKYYKLKNVYDENKSKADRIRKHLVYYSDMKPYENMKTLGEFYFKRQKRICRSDYEYNVAILNHDPDKIETCYYPTFSKQNKYSVKHTEDYNPELPFWIAFDYNFKIAPLPIVQVDKLPFNNYETVNFIDSIFTLLPLGIVDCVNEMCDKYADHKNKKINYIFDQTAIGRNPLKTTYKNEVVKAFEARKWTVIEHYIGEQPDHHLKFTVIKNILTARGINSVMVNELMSAQLIKSIELSGAYISGDKTKKDKSTENNDDWPAEDSTHFSDAFDMILWGLFEWDLLNKKSSFTPGITSL